MLALPQSYLHNVRVGPLERWLPVEVRNCCVLSLRPDESSQASLYLRSAGVDAEIIRGSDVQLFLRHRRQYQLYLSMTSAVPVVVALVERLQTGAVHVYAMLTQT
jgi:hypothetical protein